MKVMNVSQDSDEEEVTLFVELSGVLHGSLLESSGADFKVIGLESEKPILQIADQVFEGQFEDVCGTVVILEEESTNKKSLSDPSLDKYGSDKMDTKSLKYHDLCKRKLVMRKVLVSPQKKNNKEGDTSKDSDPQMSKIESCNKSSFLDISSIHESDSDLELRDLENDSSMSVEMDI